MKRPATRTPAARPRRGPAPPAPAPLTPLAPGARAALHALAALLALALVSYPIYDPDLWQHLRVGRALWEGLGWPRVNVWTWPTYGAPDVVPSWLFRAALWPFWRAGEVNGIFAWRWVTTLAAFALALMAARAGHARGARFAPTGAAALLAVVWCVIVYRYRSQARPETLVAVLLGAQLWALESWRARGGGRRWWLVPVIAMAWANAHISYTVGLFVTFAYLLDAGWRRWRGQPGPPPRQAALALGLSAVASFLNPYGWRILAQPFEYLLLWRNEPIFRLIGELAAPDWEAYAPAALPLWLALLALLALGRARRHADLAQLAILAFLIPQSLGSQRFLGYLAVAAAPFFARDLTWALGALPRPAALGRPGPRAVAGAAVMGALALAPLTTPPLEPDLRMRWDQYPVRACDFIEREGVRGRSFNHFQQGGYLLWRFWPEPGRLPFMDIHQTGTRHDRALYVYAQVDARAWNELDRRHRFDWVLLSRLEHERSRLLDVLDADSAWALVFLDNAAALYVRRNGVNAAAAERHGYRLLPGGDARLGAIGARASADPAFRDELRAELERSAGSSPWNSDALSPLANFALVEGRWTEALDLLDRAERIAPRLAALHDRRALALSALGRRNEARAAWRRAARAGSAAARDSLAALERGWR